MARIARKWILFEEALFHVSWQCHNKAFLLKPRWAKKFLYKTLLKYKDKYGVVLFSYMIMDNHLHLSGQAPDLESFSKYFQVVNSVFAMEINKRNKTCGQVIRDRFKSPVVQDENALAELMAYHDLNEVRSGKAQDPREAEFSSYKHYAEGKVDPLVTTADFYYTLGKTAMERQLAYRAMVLDILTHAPRKKNGQYTQSLFIGDPQWVEEKCQELKVLRRRLREGIIESGQDPPKVKKQ